MGLAMELAAIDVKLDNLEAMMQINTALIKECLTLVRSRAARRVELPAIGLEPTSSAQAFQVAS